MSVRLSICMSVCLSVAAGGQAISIDSGGCRTLARRQGGVRWVRTHPKFVKCKIKIY